MVYVLRIRLYCDIANILSPRSLEDQIRLVYYSREVVLVGSEEGGKLEI
jgi:hypothetical protein